MTWNERTLHRAILNDQREAARLKGAVSFGDEETVEHTAAAIVVPKVALRRRVVTTRGACE